MDGGAVSPSRRMSSSARSRPGLSFFAVLLYVQLSNLVERLWWAASKCQKSSELSPKAMLDPQTFCSFYAV